MSFTNINENDNFITNIENWELIKKYIPNDKKIWSPFYCNGAQKDYFKELGYDIIHEDEDFFENDKGEIIIDNPPFGNLRNILTRLKELNKPFIMIMPSAKINAVWFQKLFRDHLQLIIPIKKLAFTNNNPDIKFNFNWGIYFYCWKMNLPKDLIFID